MVSIPHQIAISVKFAMRTRPTSVGLFLGILMVCRSFNY